MRKLVLFLVLLLGISSAAVAQDVSTADIFAGYSFFHCADDAAQCNLNGWNAAADLNLNRNWAITVDVSGHYGTYDGEVSDEDFSVKYHTFMVGPKYTFGNSERLRPYIHALYGMSQISQPEPLNLERYFVQVYGGGLDVRVDDRFSIRAGQFEYFGIRRLPNVPRFESNLRFSAGLIIRFGQK
ncbi:MAG: porin family protein [Acidobacteria bacterium]|nr:porin family protein [Acidobacteriota bacterium]